MTMEALGSIGITPDSTIKALSVSVAGWLCEVSGKIVGFSMRDLEASGYVTPGCWAKDPVH